MSPALCREEARRLLNCPRCATVLPARAGLLWRTHDGGLTGYREERLDESLREALRRLLGTGRQRAPERAACPVHLLYGLAVGRLQLAHSAEEPGSLPGQGILLRVKGQLICLSSSPLACLEALAEAESQAREAVLGRLLGSPGAAPAEAGTSAGPGDAGSCGRCAERAAGLLGDGPCLGGCCANHS